MRTQSHASSILMQSADSESVSSCPSETDSSDESSSSGTANNINETVASEPQMHRLKYTLSKLVQNKVPPSVPAHSVLPHKSNEDKTVILVPGFLHKIQKLQKLIDLFENSHLAFPIHDRKSNLVYSHDAYRVEVALRFEYHRMYRKIINTTIALFDHVLPVPFQKQVRRDKFYPEIEYIVYDCGRFPNAHIEPHVDNHSIVTGIVMLSEPGVDFQGGINFFKGSASGDAKNNSRSIQLQQGDLVLFRGERVSHWISPVTSGVRRILQWEFSRI